MEFLDLKDNELDNVIVGDEEVKRFEADARWLAIGRLNTPCPFSSSAMFETLKSVWSLARASAEVQGSWGQRTSSCSRCSV